MTLLRHIVYSYVAALLLIPVSGLANWTGTVTSGHADLTGTGGDDTITISVSGSYLSHSEDSNFNSDVDFDSSADGDQRIMDDHTGSVTMDGLGGTDTMFFRDGPIVNTANKYLITTNSLDPGAGFDGPQTTNRPLINFDNIENLRLQTQEFNDNVKVLSTEAGTEWAITASLTTNITVGSFGEASLDNVLGSVRIVFGHFVDFIDIDSTNDHDYTISWPGNLVIDRSGGTKLTVSNSDSIIRLFGSSGVQRYFIQGNRYPHFEIDLAGTKNSLFVDSPTHNLDDISNVSVVNGGGNTDAQIVDSGTHQGHAYLLGNAFALSRDGVPVISQPATSATIILSKYNDSFVLTHDFGSSHYTVDAGTGNHGDVFSYIGQNFAEELGFSGDTNTLFAQGIPAATLQGFEAVHLTTGDAGDTVTISPSATCPISVDGESPDVPPADNLILNPYGLPFQVSADTFSVPGYLPVNYYGFESVSEVTPPEPKADLNGAISDVNISCRTYYSQLHCTVFADLVESNSGDKNAPGSTTNFYLSDNPTLEPTDALMYSASMTYFNAGQSRTINFSLHAPANSDPHGKYLITVLDSDNVVPENNEGDNIIVTGPLP
jgi:hypothetical protein